MDRHFQKGDCGLSRLEEKAFGRTALPQELNDGLMYGLMLARAR
jgi:hypothetical protein